MPANPGSIGTAGPSGGVASQLGELLGVGVAALLGAGVTNADGAGGTVPVRSTFCVFAFHLYVDSERPVQVFASAVFSPGFGQLHETRTSSALTRFTQGLSAAAGSAVPT